MSIIDFVEMTILLCLICFSICAKIQGFVDKYVFFFLRFTQKFKMVANNDRKTIFWEKSPVDSAYTLWVKNFIKMALYRTVSKINACLSFIQTFNMAAKNGRKTTFRESHQ